jgi:hypothetical protein
MNQNENAIVLVRRKRTPDEAIASAMVNALRAKVKYTVTMQRAWAIAKDAVTLGEEKHLGRMAKGAVEFLLKTGELRAVSAEDVMADGRVVNRVYVTPVSKSYLESPSDWEEVPGLTAQEVQALNSLQAVQYGPRHHALRFIKAFGTSRLWAVQGKMPGSEQGSFKFASVLKIVADWEANGFKPIRLYCRKDRRYYFTSPLAHMGGVVARSLMGYSRPFKGSRLDIQAAWGIAKDEGVTPQNYLAIITSVRSAIRQAELEKGSFKSSKDMKYCPRDGALATLGSVAKQFGFKLEKVLAKYDLAMAMLQLEQLGETSYIFQQDCTSDGYQRIAALTGCSKLARYTNLGGHPDKVSLYKESEKFARALYTGSYDSLLDESKFFVMRIGYGAGSTGLSKGLILNNPESHWDLVSDEAGEFCPSKAKEMSAKMPDIFNPDTVDQFSQNWDTAWDEAKKVSKAYSDALTFMFPKLREFIRSVREAYKNAYERNEMFTWQLGDGSTTSVFKVDWDYDHGADRVTFTAGDRKFKVSIMQRRLVCQPSAAPPLCIHAEDASHVTLLALVMAKRGLNYSPIHDSHGTSVNGIRDVKRFWKAVFWKFYMTDNSRLVANLARYGVVLNPKVWKEGWTPINRENFLKSTHFMG